ncbi:hypothetical protein [Caulobacter soli]|uniref:hypothetical protein n=1 Tax=Caulobacter soli TaxID=2708539 RepID=UPI0013EAAE54|nr:hypothetical protein [Caulobacter soli]
MRSSKSGRDRLGAALASLLGLTGIALLILARPIATPFPYHMPYHMNGGHAPESQRAVRAASPAPPAAREVADIGDVVDIPDDAPPRVSRPAVTPGPAWVAPPSPESVAVPEDAASPAPGPRVLATILRASGLACLDGREALLSPGERELCRERLGAEAWRGSSLPAIAPDERADYDAAARAQAPRRALVPLTARGAGGAFDDRSRAGRRPRVGCALRFGLNADRTSDGSTGALRAGPCSLQAPAAAPPEADLRRAY